MIRPSLKQVLEHFSSYGYMNDINRTEERIELYGEIFTPTALVSEIFDNFPPSAFSDPRKTFLDPSCGDGQFLCEVLIRKMKNGIDFETGLCTIFGVDIMEDNVALCRERLLCGQTDLYEIVEKQIVCADALAYHFRFDGTPIDNVQFELFGGCSDELQVMNANMKLTHINSN